MTYTELAEDYVLRYKFGTPNVACSLCDGIVPFRESAFFLTSDYPVEGDGEFFFLCSGCRDSSISDGFRRGAEERLSELALWDGDDGAFAVLREALQERGVNTVRA